MGRHVYGYTEARIDGKWYCIDFYQHDMEGNLHHIPCIEGQSMVYSALDWDCNVQRISPPDDLSELDTQRLYGKRQETVWRWRHVLVSLAYGQRTLVYLS